MEQSLSDLLERGITDELDASAHFIALVRRVPSMALKQLFLTYADNELAHAITLLEYLEELFPGHTFQMPALDIPDISDPMVFLVNYLAKEEAAVFYYVALAEMTEDKRMQKLFVTIGEEEKHHYNTLKKIIAEHTPELLNGDEML